jgi:hypothetical protein
MVGHSMNIYVKKMSVAYDTYAFRVIWDVSHKFHNTNIIFNILEQGISQWSVHGPILFTIYINDLPDIVQNVAKLFADDTKLYATVINTNDERKLQGDIDRLMQWSKDWLLTFNKSKCKHVHFSPPNNAKYQMGGDYQHPIHSGVLFFQKDFIAIYLVYIVNNSNLLYCKDGNPRYLDRSL